MIRIAATVTNTPDNHAAIVSTAGSFHILSIAPKTQGRGSSASGAELLLLALATCYCNDIFREGDLRNITVASVEVEASADFDGTPGNPLHNITYHATVEADASEADILSLMAHTDIVAEIQNTLRDGSHVALKSMKAVPMTR